MDWYTLRVISGKEKKIKEAILYDVSISEMDDKISDVLVPSENIVEMRDGKKKIKERVFFPGYLLVRLEMDKETKYLLENVNGVISFVGPKGEPQPLKPEEAQRFLGDFEGGDGPLRVTEAAPFKVGDAVQLTFTETGSAMTDGSYTIATVTTDSNDAITGFTVTDSASGTVAAQDVQILSTQTPANSIVLGYLFDMEIEFPTIYKLENQGENRWRADVQSSLVIHRAKFSFGPTGVYTTTLKRVGKPTYTETFESTQADAYYANTVGIENEQLATLPIYERNTTLNLTLKSTHPSPATLYSMAWEGDYSPKYYQRV